MGGLDDHGDAMGAAGDQGGAVEHHPDPRARQHPRDRDLADPRRVLQARDTSLVLAGHAINMARRGDDGFWRYAISLLDLGPG